MQFGASETGTKRNFYFRRKEIAADDSEPPAIISEASTPVAGPNPLAISEDSKDSSTTKDESRQQQQVSRQIFIFLSGRNIYCAFSRSGFMMTWTFRTLASLTNQTRILTTITKRVTASERRRRQLGNLRVGYLK